MTLQRLVHNQRLQGLFAHAQLYSEGYADTSPLLEELVASWDCHLISWDQHNYNHTVYNLAALGVLLCYQHNYEEGRCRMQVTQELTRAREPSVVRKLMALFQDSG